jgi:uracil-DNA glycosylase
MEPGWKKALESEFVKPYFHELTSFVRSEYNTATVYPPAAKIFNALDATPLPSVKVCILGQDPYHGEGQANGLSFSVNEGVKLPPSLVNIFREIKEDVGSLTIKSGDLTPWAEQGVLLLNATLTVRAHEAGSHQKKGWETFTDAVIRQLNAKSSGVVFMLWGSYARSKRSAIDKSKNLVLESPHPSPLSAYRGFFGCRHFSRANAYLTAQGKEPILW